MKKHQQLIRRWTILCICIISFNSYSAQNQKNSYSLGTTKQFIQELEHEIALVKDSKSSPSLKLKISNSEFLNAKVNYQKTESSKEIHLQGEILGKEGGSFVINSDENKTEGSIILMKDKKAYSYYSDASGNSFIKETDINNLICYGMPEIPKELKNKKTNKANKAVTAADIANLQSYVGASACIYLDFDGYNLPAGSGWNSGNALAAQPSGMTPDAILATWESISEDFRPFFLNVTNNEAVFNSYPINKRIRCVFTPTNFMGSYSGIAFLNSFSNPNDNDTPCWAFTLGASTTGKYAGDIASHEIGHTMGLFHDGKPAGEYYLGYGEWGPIMGSPVDKKVSQWSKGEYIDAINKQDDFYVIASANGIPFRQDDAGNTPATASSLFYNSNQFYSGERVIEKSNDIDVYTFNSSGGSVSLTVKTVAKNANLRFKVTLSGGSQAPIVVASYPFDLSVPVVINTNLTPGKYYITVEPVDYAGPDLGFSVYGSVGSYQVTGTLSSSSLQRSAQASNQVKVNEEIKIYPNPVQDDFTIDTGNKDQYEVQIFNAAGQFIYKRNIQETKNKIPFSDKPTGKYMVTVRNIETGIAKTFPIIKK